MWTKSIGELLLFGCVCLFFSHDISKTNADRITKLDTKMNPGNPFILGSNEQRLRLRVTKNIAGVGLCTVVNAGFFSIFATASPNTGRH